MKPISAFTYPTLRSQIWLEPVNEQTIMLVRDWRNQSKSKFLDSHTITANEQANWYQRYLKDESDLFWLVRLSNRVAVGSIALTHVTDECAEIGRLMVAPDYQGVGIAKLAEKAATEYGFNVLKLKWLYTYVKVGNIPPFKVAEAAGFRTVSMENQIIYMENRP